MRVEPALFVISTAIFSVGIALLPDISETGFIFSSVSSVLNTVVVVCSCFLTVVLTNFTSDNTSFKVMLVI